MSASSSAREYLNMLLYHRELFQHRNFCYITHSSTWQLYFSRRLALILHTFILYSIITSFFQDLVSGYICYHDISFEITMISLPPKLHDQIVPHSVVTFTKNCDKSCNCTAHWGLSLLVGLVFFSFLKALLPWKSTTYKANSFEYSFISAWHASCSS